MGVKVIETHRVNKLKQDDKCRDYIQNNIRKKTETKAVQKRM